MEQRLLRRLCVSDCDDASQSVYVCRCRLFCLSKEAKDDDTTDDMEART